MLYNPFLNNLEKFGDNTNYLNNYNLIYYLGLRYYKCIKEH